MKPEELYARTPESVDKDINRLIGFYYCHVPEIEEHEHNGYIEDGKNERVTFNIYKDYCFDGRRTWTLAAVKFDDDFVMVIQNAGREGDDCTGRFITNKPKYDEMVAYIKTLLPVGDDVSACDVVGISDDITSLAAFYGNNLDGVFEPY